MEASHDMEQVKQERTALAGRTALAPFVLGVRWRPILL